jgi:hypothetical protein
MSASEIIKNAIASATMVQQNTNDKSCTLFRPPIYSLLPSEYKSNRHQQIITSLPPLPPVPPYHRNESNNNSREKYEVKDIHKSSRDRSRSRDRYKSSRDRSRSRDRYKSSRDRSRSRDRYKYSMDRSNSRDRYKSSRDRSCSRDRYKSSRDRSSSRDRYSRREIIIIDQKTQQESNRLKIFNIHPDRICNNNNNCLEHKLKICMKLHPDQIDEVNYLYALKNDLKLVNEKINKFYHNARCNYYNKNHQPQYIRNLIR